MPQMGVKNIKRQFKSRGKGPLRMKNYSVYLEFKEIEIKQ